MDFKPTTLERMHELAKSGEHAWFFEAMAHEYSFPNLFPEIADIFAEELDAGENGRDKLLLLLRLGYLAGKRDENLK